LQLQADQNRLSLYCSVSQEILSHDSGMAKNKMED